MRWTISKFLAVLFIFAFTAMPALDAEDKRVMTPPSFHPDCSG